MNLMNIPRVVVIGGGTGTFTVLTGLKKYALDLTAVVAMADSGGSTGVLRDELGVLPPGDVRQCLVALSNSDLLMRRLINYRFEGGSFKGHSFGNLLLAALEKTTGNFEKAIEAASAILSLKGRVLPSTLDKVDLIAELKNGQYLVGEDVIREANLKNLRRPILNPRARANPEAVKAIKGANCVIIGPGDLYPSLVANLLVRGVREALGKTRAQKIYICNLMNKKGHTDNFSVVDYAQTIERYAQTKMDCVVYNNRRPPADLLKKYATKKEYLVSPDGGKKLPSNFIGADLINRRPIKPSGPDLIKRHFIRHHPDRLARVIARLIRVKGIG